MAYASRQSDYLIAGLGTFLQATAAWLCSDSLLLSGTDGAWNLPHLILYSSVVLAAIGVWRGLRISLHQVTPSLSPFRFVNNTGLKLIGLGCLIETIAVAWGDVTPCVLGCEGWHLSAYGLLIFGILTANFGAVLGLSIELGMVRREFIIISRMRRWVVSIFVLLAFSALWLAGSAALILTESEFSDPATSWLIAFLLALFATFVMIPLKRIMPKIGSSLGVASVFNTVAYAGLVLYADYHLYLPWGILPIAVFELALWKLAPAIGFKNAALVSSSLIGVLFGETYYPFTRQLFAWSFSLQPQLLFPLAGSVAGAYFGILVYSALYSAILSNVAVSL